jgi:subtilisin family serine protease
MSSSQNTASIFSTNSGADASVFELLHPDLLGLVKSKLQQAAETPDLFTQVFGDKANTVELQTVRSQWSVGDFRNLPSVQILSAANTNGAVGAYVNQTIYLSDALFQPNAAPSSSVFGAAGVLVEETFHFLDSLVGSDTVGDEGEYAKDLIFGVTLNDSELNRVRSEDDRGFISVSGQQILAELAFDYAGNTLGTARAVTVSSSTTTFQDWVGSADTNDYYRFSLGGTSNLNLSLTGLTADADIQLLNSAGTVIRSSTAGGSSSEFITQQLAAGTYYVRVYPFSSNSTYYNLGLSAIPVVPPDYAGNTLGTARAVTLSSSTTTFQDWVGSADTNDYYRFSLGGSSNLNLSLTGLTADADVQLLNSAGTVIRSSTAGGSSSEFITQQLAAGTYYVRVYPFSSNSTYYNLGLSAIPVVPPDYAGNTLGTARAVTLSSSTTTFQDWVGSADTNDYYRFSLGGSSNLNLSLTGLTADADVQLLNSAGTVIRSSTAGGSSSEFITQQLAAGTYYVRVYPFSSNSTYYNLGLSAIPVVPPTPPVPPIPPNGFSSVYGYGLINAAAAVARAIGQSTPFADVPNLGGNNWGNDLVNAPESWARGYTGQGVVVAVVDTGVDYNHVDLNDNIWVNTREIAGNGIDDDGNGYIDDVRGWDFVDRDNTPLDGGSHGTHVAGTIAAENNGLGVTGVAYNARIMAVRVLGPNGGTYQDVASGIRYAANNGANVINLSLGGGYSADIESAIQYASSRGSIVVMAAGNDGLSQPGNPARIATQYGLSVGAVDINRNIASFSNRAGSDSALQHIVAPGVNVYSTTPGNTYRFLNGTSMATPHVAGVIALMLSANRSLTPTQVRSIVTSSASRLSQSSTGSLGVNTVTGSNIPQGIGISVSSNLPDANSLNDFASLDYQTVTSGANPSTTNLTTPSQNVGLIQTTVSNVVSSESTRKPVSTSKPLNVARNILDIFGNEILDSSLVNQSDWILGTI